MVRPLKKVPFAITLNNLVPSYLDYDYFSQAVQLLFRYTSNKFDLLNTGGLIGAATLVYADEDSVN